MVLALYKEFRRGYQPQFLPKAASNHHGMTRRSTHEEVCPMHDPATVAPPAGHDPGSNRAAVVQALLRFGRQTVDAQPSGPPSFTPNPAANAFLVANPFAFLLAVIFDQQIPAERAWEAPYLLWQRLGHLDPQRMVANPEAVTAAVQQRPALHRYVNTVPGRLVAAAARVLDEYDGDAGLIWADMPRATDLQRRLEAFKGIGQKKAAMAVEILERDMGVPIRALHGSDIAYDIHVRRVFLRTRLAERDDLEHMVAVAREAYPDRPGAIDLPAWLVGRQWCHAGVPDCPNCVLTEVCPKDIARAAGVLGV